MQEAAGREAEEREAEARRFAEWLERQKEQRRLEWEAQLKELSAMHRKK